MMNQFIYVLKLIPSLIKPENWTDRDNEIVERHFNRLQEWKEEGFLILAGRTLQMDENTFGIVIFEAVDEECARTLMQSDPAVAEGVMTADLYPYRVALSRFE
jgi:uncharacterized protein YciI